MAFQVHLIPRKGGVRPDFRLFDGETPKEGEIIEIKENGHIINARVTRVLPRSGSQTIDHIEAVEIG